MKQSLRSFFCYLGIWIFGFGLISLVIVSKIVFQLETFCITINDTYEFAPSPYCMDETFDVNGFLDAYTLPYMLGIYKVVLFFFYLFIFF